MSLSEMTNLWRRGFRTAPLCLAAATLLASGCVATKGDVRMLQGDLAALQARQDSLQRVQQRDLQRQDRMVLDSLRSSAEFMRNMSGTINNKLRELTETMKVLEALVGQTQQRIAEARAEQQAAAQQVTQPVTPPAGNSQSPDDLYREAMSKFNEKSYATARLIFEQILADFPQHVRAADAQYHLGEAYAQDGDYEQAYQELERVAAMFPSHPRARMALYRAGAIAEEQRDRARARKYYQQVTGRYAGTDEAREAAKRLRALN